MDPDRDDQGPASATNDSFSWTVSGPATAQARIRATWASNGLVADTSDVDFTIVNSVLITIGETNTLPIEDGNNGNLLIAQQATLTQAATIQSLSFYVTNAAGDLRLGIYDATGPGGDPEARRLKRMRLCRCPDGTPSPSLSRSRCRRAPIGLPICRAATAWVSRLITLAPPAITRSGSARCRRHSQRLRRQSTFIGCWTRR